LTPDSFHQILKEMGRAAADRPLVREINRALVLHEIRRRGPLSRSEIARATGLSTATVGAITSELLSYGLVAEADGSPGGRGRPGTPLTFLPSAFQVVGIKLMEDHLVGAVTNLEAEPIAEEDEALDGFEPAQVVAAAKALVDRLYTEAELDRKWLLGVGIGMAGIVDGDRGTCRYSPFLGWTDVPLASMASDAVGVPVRLENDVNTLALAERWFGVGHDIDDFVLVTLGRGIGLGVVSDGRLYRGAAGGAGEFGHTVVDGNARPCPCGNIGCLEASVSEPALLDAARTLLGSQAGELTGIEDVYAKAKSDPRIGQLLGQAGRTLGRGLANVVNLFAPELVIVSGEGIRGGDPLLAPMGEELTSRVFPGLRNTFELAVEPLPDAAWARGAASLVLDDLFDSPLRAGTDLLWSREMTS
jgi:N-acetylglucosamine repressor